MTNQMSKMQKHFFFRTSLIVLFLLTVMALAFFPSLAQSNLLSFGQGAGIQMVDPDGLNQIPFWADTGDTTVDFTLYQLLAPAFAQRYGTYNSWGGQQQPIDVSGLTVAATWQQSFSGGNSYDLRSAAMPTPTVASGIYVIEAKNGSSLARSMLTYGRTVLTAKWGSAGQVTVWAARLQNGAPVADMNITLYNAQGTVVTQGATNVDGVVTFAVGKTPNDYNNQDPNRLLLAVGQGSGESAGEISVVGLDWQWRNYSSYNGYYGGPYGNSRTHQVYLYTDRPIYRPGQTIFYNAILRNNTANGYTLIGASEAISLTLRDARNNIVATQAVTADEFGAVNGDFMLGAEPPLGDYKLELTIGLPPNQQSYSQQLRVEAYRKPEYEVKVTTPAPYAIQGDSIPLTVAANYYFGQPVGQAQVKLDIYREPRYRYNYGWWWYESSYGYYNGGLVTTLTGVTDADGNWSTSYTPEINEKYDYVYSLRASVTDARNQPVTGESTVTLYWNSFELAVNTDQYGYRTDEPVTVNVAARDHAGAPQANQALTVRIVRHEWSDNSNVDAVPAQQVTTDSAGRAAATFSNIPQGWYLLLTSGTDARGRTIESYNYLWVYDAQAQSWWFTNNNELFVTADKASYAPGDTAKLLIQSRVNGMALLTLERAGVQYEQIVTINGPVTAVDVPITADAAPNVFATVQLYKPASDLLTQRREGQLISAQTELIVPASDKQLKVEITANAAAYKPGDNAQLTLRVTDASGAPVRARVSLALVDEAIFALQKEYAGDPFAAFYSRVANSVATYDGLARQPYNYYYTALDNEGVPTGTPAPTGTPLAIPAPAPPDAQITAVQPRRLFLDTAFWQADLVTDDQGLLTVNVPLPDNLTTWRATAKAFSVDTKVGEGKTNLLVTQEIIARPTLPRFAVLGDRFQTGVVAQNFSGSETSGTADLAATNLLLLNPGAQSLTLPNRGSALRQWTVVASQLGSGLVTNTVSTSAGTDIVELPLLVKPFAAPERWTAAGQANLTASEHFTVPTNAIHNASNLTLHLAPSLALGLLDGLDELIDFPYGCVEQTMSRVLPSAVAAKTYAALGIPNPKAEQLPEIINQGVQKLYGFQHTDGSWGWFYDDEGGAYLTAYVLFGLVNVQQAGFTVDAAVLDKGFGFLDEVLKTINDPGVLAYALYVKAVAGRGDLPATQALISQQGQMEASAQAALALALKLGGDSSTAQTVADKLAAQAVETATMAFWPLPTGGWDWWRWTAMPSVEKNTAAALRALLAIHPEHPLLPKAVRWLMDHRQGAGWGGYGSTQATAYAVLGLSEYIQQKGELQANYSWNVTLNGATVANGQVTPATARQPIAPINVPGQSLHLGSNELRIERSAAEGGFYYSALLEQQLFYDSFTPVASLDQGLKLTRSYALKEGTPRSDGAYNVGDLVEVTLKLDVRDEVSYVLVEDPIPAGFEGVQERVNPYTWGDCWEFCYGPLFYWQEWGYNRKELRDDRVDFFITRAWPGTHTLTYQLRATTPGEYSVLPGQAFPMYKEEIWGRSASQQVQVAPEQLVARPALLGDFDRDCRVTAFDTQLLAAVYGASATNRDVTGDARVSLADLAAVAGRSGANCSADRSVPGSGTGAVAFAITMPEQIIQVGERFAVQVTLTPAAQAASELGGFGLTINFDSHRLSVVDVQWNPALSSGLPLGPQVDNGQGKVSVGAFNMPANFTGSLVTLTFMGTGVGPTSGLSVINAEAVDGQGRLITATAHTNGGVAVDGEQIFLSMILR